MATLPVKQYYSQTDSTTGMGWRMCFSSSCAMALKYLEPDALLGANADDDYLKRVLHYGDTTDATAQVSALRSYGLEAHFRTDGSRKTLEEEIALGYPVATGILHHGNVHTPSGGGHWMLVIGSDDSHVICQDPYGELDCINGGYVTIGSGGKNVHYSWQNWLPRWEVDGPGTGWYVSFRRPLPSAAIA
jgi:hypothetical protein